MINDETQLDIIYEKWNSILVQYFGSHIVFDAVRMLAKTKKFLQRFGLPLLGFNYSIEFIPATYTSKVKVNNEEFYLLGDLSVRAPGMSFLGIKKEGERVYRLSRRKKENVYWKVAYLNMTLEKFVIFLYSYCEFMTKYKEIDYALIDGGNMLREYNEMRSKLSELDPKAMEDDNYWDNMVASIQGIYGDFLL